MTTPSPLKCFRYRYHVTRAYSAMDESVRVSIRNKPTGRDVGQTGNARPYENDFRIVCELQAQKPFKTSAHKLRQEKALFERISDPL